MASPAGRGWTSTGLGRRGRHKTRGASRGCGFESDRRMSQVRHPPVNRCAARDVGMHRMARGPGIFHGRKHNRFS